MKTWIAILMTLASVSASADELSLDGIWSTSGQRTCTNGLPYKDFPGSASNHKLYVNGSEMAIEVTVDGRRTQVSGSVIEMQNNKLLKVIKVTPAQNAVGITEFEIMLSKHGLLVVFHDDSGRGCKTLSGIKSSDYTISMTIDGRSIEVGESTFKPIQYKNADSYANCVPVGKVGEDGLAAYSCIINTQKK